MLIGFRQSVRIINRVIAVLNITAALELLSPYIKKLPMLRRIFIRCFELWIFIHHKMLIGFHKSARIIFRAIAFLNITAALELLSPYIKKLPMLRRISIRCFELWIFIHHKMLIGFHKSARIIFRAIAFLNITFH